MKFEKKWLLSALFASALTACGGGSNNDDNSDSGPTNPTVTPPVTTTIGWGAAIETEAMNYYNAHGFSHTYYDYDSDTSSSTEVDGWDLLLTMTSSYMPTILLGDGVSVAVFTEETDNPDDAYKWDGNNIDGAMRGPGNLGGLQMAGGYSNLKYYPTYTTYLLKEGATYYKVQFLGYKGEDGLQGSGNIVLRYAANSGSGWSQTNIATMDASDSKTIAVFNLADGTSNTVSAMENHNDNWHFSYQKHVFVKTNGGVSGSGNGAGEIESCVADEYPGLYDEAGEPLADEFEKLTAANTLANFEAIATDACANFAVDSELTPSAIGSDWYTVEGRGISGVSAEAVWVLRAEDGQGGYNYARISPNSVSDGSNFTFNVQKWEEIAQ